MYIMIVYTASEINRKTKNGFNFLYTFYYRCITWISVKNNMERSAIIRI